MGFDVDQEDDRARSTQGPFVEDYVGGEAGTRLRSVDFEINIGPTREDGSVPVSYSFATDADSDAYHAIVRQRAVAAVVRVALAGVCIEPTGRLGRRGHTRPVDVAHADYYDQYTAPLKKARFLKLAREGAFPVRRDGILRLVLRTDFEAYLATRAVHLVPRGPLARPDEADDILERVGLRRVKP